MAAEFQLIHKSYTLSVKILGFEADPALPVPPRVAQDQPVEPKNFDMRSRSIIHVIQQKHACANESQTERQ